jgi:hypothetical protein
MYDGLPDGDLHGEDDESREPVGESLPTEVPDGFDLEYYLSYPQEKAVGGPKHASIDWFLASILPGDGDRPPPSPKPAEKTIDALASPDSDVRTSESELPSDSGNPSARSDYYDRMTMGSRRSSLLTGADLESDITDEDAMADLVRGVREADRLFAVDEGRFWPSEDSGSYVTQEQKDVERSDEDVAPYRDGDGHYVDDSGVIESYPQPEWNDQVMDNGLGALGNSDSGYVVEDMSNPRGFPTGDFMEEADFLDENPILPEVWHLQPFGYAATERRAMTIRVSTDVEKVRDLTKAFLKEHGRKSIVRRSVLSFLQGRGLPQYLASDIIRCMKHDHDILIPDVMDTFPISSEATDEMRRMASIHGRLLELSLTVPDAATASRLNRCAARIAHAIMQLERADDGSGNI